MLPGFIWYVINKFNLSEIFKIHQEIKKVLQFEVKWLEKCIDVNLGYHKRTVYLSEVSADQKHSTGPLF